MIKSFHDKTTAATFLGRLAKRLPADIRRRCREKLTMVHAATRLDDLRVPPSNHLEALKGDRSGQHSIRVTGQWRICFTWKDGDVYNVEITDYH